jgi:hypothetical protein
MERTFRLRLHQEVKVMRRALGSPIDSTGIVTQETVTQEFGHGVFVNFGAVKDGFLKLSRPALRKYKRGKTISGLRVVSIDLESQTISLEFDDDSREDKVRSSSEPSSKKMDPADDKSHTLAELKETYKELFSDKEIEACFSSLTEVKEYYSKLFCLPEEMYLSAALHLDAHALCAVDATCRTLRVLNQSCLGPWHALGARTFRGIELAKVGIFDAADAPESKAPLDNETQYAQYAYREGAAHGVHLGLGGVNKLVRLDWKKRYRLFKQSVPARPFIPAQKIRQAQNHFVCCRNRESWILQSKKQASGSRQASSRTYRGPRTDAS